MQTDVARISKVKELWAEFKTLEAAIQAGSLGDRRVELVNRYVQLLGLFYPVTRAQDWQSPLGKEEVSA